MDPPVEFDFTDRYHQSQLPEFRGQYLPYDELKCGMFDIAHGGGPEAVAAHFQVAAGLHHFGVVGQHEVSKDHHTKKAIDALLARIGAEAQNIGLVMDSNIESLVAKFKELTPKGGDSSLRNQSDAESICCGIDMVRTYAVLNEAALYRLMLHHDKVLSTNLGASKLFRGYAKMAKVDNLSHLDDFGKQVTTFLSSQARGQQDGLSLGASKLVDGVGKHMSNQDVIVQAKFLWFLLGALLSLSLALLLLIGLPPKEPETFSEAYFLSSFSAFRIVLSLCVTLWGIGWMIQTFESKGINYQFLLGIDPHCSVNADWFFSRAALHTSMLVLLWGMYTVDYKWIKFTITSNHHYMCYPLAAFLSAIIPSVVPSTQCHFADKFSFLKSMCRVMLAPLFLVNFADNIMGDAMTSYVKPLQDVPSALCYFSAYRASQDMKDFLRTGSECPPVYDLFLPVFIAAFPMWFKMMQCLRRYYDTKQTAQLVNASKFAIGLVVALITNIKSIKQVTPVYVIVILCLTVGTLSWAWDTIMDWDVGRDQCCAPICTGDRTRQDAQLLIDAEAQQGKPKPQRLFSANVYRAATFFNFFARQMWVLSMLPVTLLSSSVVIRVLLQTLICFTEVVRRCIWGILRVEKEQTNNSEGFRSLLWVPQAVPAGVKQEKAKLLSEMTSRESDSDNSG